MSADLLQTAAQFAQSVITLPPEVYLNSVVQHAPMLVDLTHHTIQTAVELGQQTQELAQPLLQLVGQAITGIIVKMQC